MQYIYWTFNYLTFLLISYFKYWLLWYSKSYSDILTWVMMRRVSTVIFKSDVCIDLVFCFVSWCISACTDWMSFKWSVLDEICKWIKSVIYFFRWVISLINQWNSPVILSDWFCILQKISLLSNILLPFFAFCMFSVRYNILCYCWREKNIRMKCLFDIKILLLLVFRLRFLMHYYFMEFNWIIYHEYFDKIYPLFIPYDFYMGFTLFCFYYDRLLSSFLFYLSNVLFCNLIFLCTINYSKVLVISDHIIVRSTIG